MFLKLTFMFHQMSSQNVASEGLKEYFGKQYAGQKDEKNVQTLPLGNSRPVKDLTLCDWWWQLKDHPENWGRFPFWREYFSDGLVQPPTNSKIVSGGGLSWLCVFSLPICCVLFLMKPCGDNVNRKWNGFLPSLMYLQFAPVTSGPNDLFC